jgi:catechol 2,3-dioxygenase-like lactoylglutathione lyase family enzyme
MPLTDGLNRVALVTVDIDRFVAFYREVFEAELLLDLDEGHARHALVDLGGGICLHPFQLPAPTAHAAGSPRMFDRGHLDHVALNVADPYVFENLRRRLVDRGASDGTVSDFGMMRTVTFRDPDGFEAEIAMWQNSPPLTLHEAIRQPYQHTDEST